MNTENQISQQYTIPILPHIAQLQTEQSDLYKDLRTKIDTKTKPLGSLGQLEDIALRLGLIQNSPQPEIKDGAVAVFAGDHGIAAEKVSAYPSEVTAQMVLNFSQGAAAINVFCRQHGLKLIVADAGVAAEFEAELNIEHIKIARGTQNFLHRPAMDKQQFQAAFEAGRKLVANLSSQGVDAVGFGEMGIGNTTAAAAIMSHLTKIPAADCTGAGTGLDAKGQAHKAQVIGQALDFHGPSLGALAEQPALHAAATLQSFGGFEMVMMAGGMVEAASRGMIIIVDGFISSASFLAAQQMSPAISDYAFFSHRSNESGHKLMLDYLGAQPILDLGLRLGEGTGAALSFPVLQSAALFLKEMASFDEAGVSQKEDPSI